MVAHLVNNADSKSHANLATQLAALPQMTCGELAERYRELFGDPARSRNKPWLTKRIAWRLQELATGGLEPVALERIKELAVRAPVRWRRHVPAPVAQPSKCAPPARRLPVGMRLTRLHKGELHCVTVVDDGYMYKEKVHRSLSAIAKLITGVQWNGYRFFAAAPTNATSK